MCIFRSPSVFAATVTLHSSNVGISALSVSIVGSNINITETWGSNAMGALLISDLTVGTNYTVTKTITNSTAAEPTDWLVNFSNFNTPVTIAPPL